VLTADAEQQPEDLRRQRLGELLDLLGKKSISQTEVAIRAKVPPQDLTDLQVVRRNLTELSCGLQEEFEVDNLWLLDRREPIQPQRVWSLPRRRAVCRCFPNRLKARHSPCRRGTARRWKSPVWPPRQKYPRPPSL